MTFIKGFGKSMAWLPASILVMAMAGCGGSDDSSSKPAPRAPGAGSGLGGLGKGPAPVNLGSAGNFVILSKAGTTNVHTSAIVGNMGSSPITSAAMDNVFCSEMTGTIFGVDAAYTGSGDASCFRGAPADKTNVDNAVLDMGSAYDDAAGRAADYTEVGAGSIGGMTLPPATYKWGTGVQIVSDMTLNGGPNDVWIFQIAQGLTQSSGTRIALTGGALPKNVFWQTVGAVDIGTTAHFEGVTLSKTSITLKTGAVANARLLAQTAVVLGQNAVTQPAP